MAKSIEKIRSLEAVAQKYKRMEATWWNESYRAGSILIMYTESPPFLHLHFKNFVGVIGISIINDVPNGIWRTDVNFEKHGFNFAHPWQNYKDFKELEEWGVDKRDITPLLFSENLVLRNLGKMLHDFF